MSDELAGLLMQLKPSRRRILQGLLLTGTSQSLPWKLIRAAQFGRAQVVDTFNRPNSLYLGDTWESLNPGYWMIKDGTLRRRLKNVGDRARATGFPFHYESQQNPDGQIVVSYDPSLPLGVMWQRHWKLTGNYLLRLHARIKALSPEVPPGDNAKWDMYQSGYGLLALIFGGNSQFESFHPSANASMMLVLQESGRFGLVKHGDTILPAVGDDVIRQLPALQEGDDITLTLQVSGNDKQSATVSGGLSVNQQKRASISWSNVERASTTDGYFGIASRGLLDVAVTSIEIEPGDNAPLYAPLNECHVCYVLGDTLEKRNGHWQVRFVSLFRHRGEQAEIRISDTPTPTGGWSSVPIAGQAAIITNEFRRNTAIIDTVLPFNPAEKTHYYTVWKDGVNVTSDPRIGTPSVGPGTGLVGDVPIAGNYVGRLPQLLAPYKICGLSCHAIHTASYAELPDAEGGRCAQNVTGTSEISCGIPDAFYVHDQPCYKAFKHIDEYDFQVMLWEDDIWYMELLLYPPSTDDAYKIITMTIAGPGTRWQMMRHWNVLNPGDHDHGMDDVKGPEQLLIRNRRDLGQDPEYMIRNFQIVSHLMIGKENPSGKDNPKRWRKWKMPNRDFSLMIMDSRLWRTSQDPAIWDDEGWGHDKELYNRKDPTRVLLGEEQFAWLQQEIKTDSSPLICLTGINALHTVWGGHSGSDWLNELLDRDRVSADYAGWVKAGADRILRLLSSRDGIVSVYGDVHAGMILRNAELRLYECSFGPIGRWGGRPLIGGFGPRFNDFDGRDVECLALYHHEFKNPQLVKQETKNYWNFLEMQFDPNGSKHNVSLTIRNLVDEPEEKARGGQAVQFLTRDTGRKPSVRLTNIKTLPDADILFLTRDGDPIRGTLSLADGKVLIEGLVDIQPGSQVIMVATTDHESESVLLNL